MRLSVPLRYAGNPRQLTEHERLAGLHFYRAVGRRAGAAVSATVQAGP
jgi:hypothetical protein